MEVVTAPTDAVPAYHAGVKMTKVDILCKMERFDALKRAMFDIGITGMTAINVMGCGEQRGKTEGYFRGARVEATMLPSIQVSIVVCRLPVRLVVETAKKVLYTGHIGDGKIFIYDVENVIKVRTGEEGYGALQDAEYNISFRPMVSSPGPEICVSGPRLHNPAGTGHTALMKRGGDISWNISTRFSAAVSCAPWDRSSSTRLS